MQFYIILFAVRVERREKELEQETHQVCVFRMGWFAAKNLLTPLGVAIVLL